MSQQPLIIKDETKKTDTRFISFKKNDYRFDLAILSADQLNGEKMVIDLHSNKLAILNKEKITKEGVLEHEFQFNEIKADVLRSFLLQLI